MDGRRHDPPFPSAAPARSDPLARGGGIDRGRAGGGVGHGVEYLGMIYPDENSHDPGDAAERPPCWLGGILALVILVWG